MGAKKSRFSNQGYEDTLAGSLLLVGLDGAGKTTFANILRLNAVIPTEPTTGMFTLMLDAYRCKGITFSICDVGGNLSNRFAWRDNPHFPLGTMCGVIFVVDSSDVEKISEARQLLSALFGRLFEVFSSPVIPVLVIANKQDIPGALTPKEVEKRLSLKSHWDDYYWAICGGSATYSKGFHKVMRKFCGMIKDREKQFVKQQKANQFVFV